MKLISQIFFQLIMTGLVMSVILSFVASAVVQNTTF